MEKEKATTNMGMTTIKASITTVTVTATFADGTTTTKAIFRQGWPRKTDCHRVWRNNLCGAANFRLGFRNGCNRARRIWNGVYPRRLRIARTF